MMHLQAYFVAHTEIHIPTLHEMRRETVNPLFGMGTSNSNLQTVFVWSLFHDVYCTS